MIAGLANGLETGGWIPKGFKTELGSQPELSKYGLVEHVSDKYPPRTYANVRDSDATIRFAVSFETAGEKCTLKAVEQYGKPHLDILIKLPDNSSMTSDDVAQRLIELNVEVLNVAGNRESTCPGIEEFATSFLTDVIKKMNKG